VIVFAAERVPAETVQNNPPAAVGSRVGVFDVEIGFVHSSKITCRFADAQL